MQNNTAKKIPALPSSWPSDKRTHIRTLPDGRIFVHHPDRAPMELIGDQWKPQNREARA